MKAAEWVVLGVLAGFSVYDLKTKRIPVAAVVLFGAAVLGYRLFMSTEFLELLAGLVPGIALLLLAVLSKESIGTGDGLVLCVVGLFCGLRMALSALAMALMLSSLVAMVLLVLRRAGKKTELPFLPCLCSGYLLCLLW